MTVYHTKSHIEPSIPATTAVDRCCLACVEQRQLRCVFAWVWLSRASVDMVVEGEVYSSDEDQLSEAQRLRNEFEGDRDILRSSMVL